MKMKWFAFLAALPMALSAVYAQEPAAQPAQSLATPDPATLPAQAPASVTAPAPVAALAPADVPAAAPPVAAKLVLAEGSDVPLTFDQDISSKTAQEGDPVDFVLAEDLKVGNTVVAKAGCKAVGEVTNAKKSGMMGKAGELNVRLDYLRVGETKVHLRGAKGKEGDSATGATVALTVLFGPIGLIKHGSNIDIKKGTAMKVYVADDASLSPVV
jgi:hypothetical protein